MEQISEENLRLLESRYRTTSIVVIVQIVSTLLLILVAWFLSPNTDNAIQPEAVSALWMLVLFIAVGTFVLKRFLFSWER